MTSRTATRGFGVAGALDREIVAQLATESESHGYSTFWANDTEQGDGLEALKAAAGSTKAIRLGVGVIPIDRIPAVEIAARIKKYDLPEDRLSIGIGSGGLKKGALAAVKQAAEDLSHLTPARVVIGALGPNMVAAAGQASDGVLLNWLPPQYAAVMSQLVRSQASGPRWVGAYVRVAVAGPGVKRLQDEGARYASYPSYGAHFERMGVLPDATCAFGTTEDIQSKLVKFDASGIDETVVRAVAASESVDAYLDVLKAAAAHG